jgi:hypothetical protein
MMHEVSKAMRQLVKLAESLSKNSYHRKVLLAFAKTGTATMDVTGGRREEFLNDVWAMYEKSYRAIGMHLNHPNDLLYYDVWSLSMRDGRPVAFNLAARTKYGFKSALFGSDGSAEGKAAVLNNIRTTYHQPGWYGEASHKVKDLALKAGAPVVCATFAHIILGKPVDVTSDISYRRNLDNVGVVEKTIFGRPHGIPTTDADNPSCPLSVDRVASGLVQSRDSDVVACDKFFKRLLS